MVSRLHALRYQRSTLSKAIKATKRDVVRKTKHTLGDGAVSRGVRLTSRLAHVVWIMYSLTADPSLAVLNVLRGAGRTQRWSDVNDEELLNIAENSFSDADLSYVSACADTDNPQDPEAMCIAQRRLAELRLFQWVRNLNVKGGTAPSTVALLRRAKQDVNMLPDAIFDAHSTGRPGLKARNWVQKWRARWHARLGNLRGCEKMHVDDMRKKVLVFLSAPPLIVLPLRSPFLRVRLCLSVFCATGIW